MGANSATVQINLMDCTAVIVTEVKQGLTQKAIALSYALAIKSESQSADQPDWKTINAAIKDRFGYPGLARIKNLAWKVFGQFPRAAEGGA